MEEKECERERERERKLHLFSIFSKKYLWLKPLLNVYQGKNEPKTLSSCFFSSKIVYPRKISEKKLSRLENGALFVCLHDE